MRRRPARIIISLALALLPAPLAADAQQPTKVSRVGFLHRSPTTATTPYREASMMRTGT